MSNTRRAEAGKPFRQERFSSSAEFERGLLANLVALRCDVLESAKERELVWAIQYFSHQKGGLKPLAAWLLEKCVHRIGSASMRKLGCRAGQIYNAEKVRAVRGELPWREREAFLLTGESVMEDVIREADRDDDGIYAEIARRSLEAIECDKRESKNHPSKYSAQMFLDLCREEMSASALESYLKELCLNPAISAAVGPWWFHELIDCLREYQAAWIAERSAGNVTTEIGSLVCDALDYALETKCMVLIEGRSRTGKTCAVKAWCEQRPGRARYVEATSTNDDVGFYRAIAESLGISSALSWKSFELRERIEAVLQTGDIVICFDESDRLWPNHIDPRAVPARINWIMELVNHNVPVALIGTPNFLKTQRMIEEKTRWAGEQFTGRIGHYQPLPEFLCESDLQKVSKALLPEGDAESISTLVDYAQASSKYIAGIRAVVNRARYQAAKEKRSKASHADIKRAIKGSVMLSDNALVEAMQAPQKASGKRSVNRSLTADLPQGIDRSAERSKPILSDEQSEESAGRNRLELHRKSGALVPG